MVQAGLAVAWAIGTDASDAFAALAPFTMMAMTFWFKSREDGPAGPSRSGAPPPEA